MRFFLQISTIFCNYAAENVVEILSHMIGKSPSRTEQELFHPQLYSFIDMHH